MRSVYILIIACLFFSCKEKYHYFSISGRVVNTGNEEPIKNAVVRVYDGIKFGGGVLGSDETYDVKENDTRTDSNGYYTLHLKTRKEFVSVAAPTFKGYYKSGGVQKNYLDAIPEGNHDNIDLYLSTWADLESLTFKAKDPFESDSFYLQKVEAVWGSAYFTKETMNKNDNSVKYNDVTITILADRYFTYQLRYKKNNLYWETKVDSFYVEGNKTYDKIVWF